MILTMRQHYIPRCFLKRFSDNERSIYTYDKIHCKKYNASLMSVCCEDDLYTISDDYVKENNEKVGLIRVGIIIKRRKGN